MHYCKGVYLTLSFFSQQNRIRVDRFHLIILKVFYFSTRATFIGRRIHDPCFPLAYAAARLALVDEVTNVL